MLGLLLDMRMGLFIQSKVIHKTILGLDLMELISIHLSGIMIMY